MEKKIKNLILELNSACNNNCIYCYIPKENRNEKADFPLDYFKKVLVQFREKDVSNVDFTGGEPTLCNELPLLVGFAKKLGYTNRTLVTNGRRLSYDSYLQKLVDVGITRIVIPLDGHDKETAESISRSPGSFEQVLKAVENIKKSDIELGLTIVVNKINYRHVREIMGKAVELGADFINIQFLLPFVEDKEVVCQKVPSSIIPSYEDASKFVKLGLQKYRDRIKINVSFIPLCYMKGYEKNISSEGLKLDRQVVNHKGYSYNMGEHLQKGSAKIKKCADCKHEKQCFGFFLSYKKEFGIEDEE